MPDLREHTVITGEQIRDWDFDVVPFLHECVTVRLKRDTRFPDFDAKYGPAPIQSFIGDIGGIEGEDEYTYLKLEGTGVIHLILLEWIESVEL